MATLGFMDNDGVDLGNKYVTKDYVMTWYPNLPNDMVAPQLWGWGRDYYGQLGDSTTTAKSNPVQTIAGGTNWRQISSCRETVCCVKSDGTLWAWGSNYYGGIGDNTTVQKSSPVQTVAGGTNWSQVSCGAHHSGAIKTNGTLWLWGSNAFGQLGNNTTANKSSPIQTVTAGTNWKQIACGYYHTSAIKTDGTLWMWGYNATGQLGDNTVAHKSSPVQTVAGGTNWKQASCGFYHTSAIKTDGTLWMWGKNVDGQLGDNTNTNKSSPVQTITGGVNWKQVACGWYFVAAIKSDGSLWCWGANISGEFGDGTTTAKSSPVQTIAGGVNWKQVACSHSHTAAIKLDGTLWLWGSNTDGQLGNNTTNYKSSPVQTIAGGTNWKSVAVGYNYTAAISEASGW